MFNQSENTAFRVGSNYVVNYSLANSFRTKRVESVQTALKELYWYAELNKVPFSKVNWIFNILYLKKNPANKIECWVFNVFIVAIFVLFTSVLNSAIHSNLTNQYP